MMNNNLIFDGDAEVQLYGQNALIPIYLHEHVLASVIGVEGSELVVHDHRYQSIQAIRDSFSGSYPEGFLSAFNRPARVEIRYEPDRKALNIGLYEASSEGDDPDAPVLWMGVLEDNLMPGYEVEWEVMKPVDENNTAFCALVKRQPALVMS